MVSPRLIRLALSAIILAAGMSWTVRAQTPAHHASPSTLGELSLRLEALAEKAGPAVVQVISSGYGPVGGPEVIGTVLGKQQNGGSGVLVDPSGYVITNAHVVDGAERVQVLLAYQVDNAGPGRSILRPRARLREAAIVGIDPETDLAILKVDEKEDMPYLELGDSDELRQGQLVFAFGSPLGLENSFTMGVVSSVARQLEPESTMIYIQTDTAINPGNSGGPLLDARGRVVGINTMIFSQSGGNEGIGFAAPSNIVRTVYEQIRASGSVRRGEIGIHAQTITPILAEGLGLSQDWGAVLADVAPGGPGAIAGLQVGDIVLTMDEKVIENARQLLVNLYQRKIGDVVRLEILRGQQKVNVRVAVLEQSNDPGRLLRLVTREENLIEQLGILGVTLDRDIRSMLPPTRKPAGVVVAARVADGPYWNALLQPGDVIYAVNTTLTPGLEELSNVLDTLVAGDPAVVQIERMGRMQYVSFQWE